VYLVINSKNQTVSNYASLKKTKVKGENSLGETPCMHLGTSVRIPNVMLLVARTVATDNIQYKYYTERSVGRRAMHSKNALGKEKKRIILLIYIYKGILYKNCIQSILF